MLIAQASGIPLHIFHMINPFVRMMSMCIHSALNFVHIVNLVFGIWFCRFLRQGLPVYPCMA